MERVFACVALGVATAALALTLSVSVDVAWLKGAVGSMLAHQEVGR